jgi:hypothetical protein
MYSIIYYTNAIVIIIILLQTCRQRPAESIRTIVFYNHDPELTELSRSRSSADPERAACFFSIIRWRNNYYVRDREVKESFPHQQYREGAI